MYAPGTMQLAEAFRNVCRSKGMEYDSFNEVAKDLENHLEDPDWIDIIKEANKYVGTIVSGSVHPCAHLLSSENILYEYGVTRLGENVCVLITSSEADEYKVLKNDYLIVKVWKLIAETFDLVGIPIISARELLESIKDDKRIWDLFKYGITCTLNQVDSDNGTQQAKKYGIHSFIEGAYIAAAIRPSFDSWRDKFLTHSVYSTGSKQLDEVLSSTNGYILYQENLMQYFEWLGVTPAESIGLIKKISKKKIKPEDFNKLEERIKKKWIENTGSEDMFQETWNMIQSCMAYGFCSAHAAATSLDMCYGAYLKVNYPLEYYTVCLNNYADDITRTNKLIKELDYFNIKLKGIKFRHSKAEYSLDKKHKIIYKGLTSIKYMNDKVANELYDLRDKQYDSFINLLVDIGQTSCDSRQLSILIDLGFFDEFGHPNQLNKQVEIFNKFYGRKQIKKNSIEGYPEWVFEKHCDKSSDKMYKFSDTLPMLIKLCSTVDYPKTTIKNRIQSELEHLGYIQTTLENISDEYYYVNEINGNWLTLYQLHTGNTIKIKSRKKYLQDTDIDVDKIIKIIEIKDEQKWRKDAMGEWYRSDETEPILTRFLVLK